MTFLPEPAKPEPAKPTPKKVKKANEGHTALNADL